MMAFKQHFLLATLTFTLIGLAGCQRTEVAKTINSSPDSESSAKETDHRTNSVLPTNSASTSPASESEALFDQTPEGLCQKFMEVLQQGDLTTAENLLTATSRANISSAGLKLEPIGGPNSKVDFDRVEYATNQKKLAMVNFTISETMDGESVSTKIAWVVKRSKQAWRISGVVLESEESSAPDYLSFENPVDVAQIQSVAGEEVIEETLTRQAKASGVEVK